MAWDLWSSPFDQAFDDDYNYSETLDWFGCFGCGYDDMEEDAKDEKCCVQVLRCMITNADNEIEQLEMNLASLQNELAWTENENWPEICCNGLTEKINQLDVAVNTLKSGHADDAEVQLLLDSGPAERLHEIVKALYKDWFQDAHGQDLLAISLVRSPDLGVVGCVPYHSERMILSDTLDDKVTGDEDIRQSQLVATDTHQILNPFLSKEKKTTLKENVFSDDRRLAIIKGSQHIASETKVKKPLLSKGNKNVPSETKEVNIPVKESVCSDDHRLAIIKSQLIAKNTGQILNPFSSKGNGNIASDAKEENTNIKGNLCSDDYRLAIVKEKELHLQSDLAQKLCDFVPKAARRARRKECKVAPDEDLESMSVPLQIVYPKKMCFADTESSALKEKNGNNALQVVKIDKATLTAENSALISLPGMQTENALCTRSSALKEKNGNNALQVAKIDKATLTAENTSLISLTGLQTENTPCTRLQLTDEEEPQAQDLKSKLSVNFSMSRKRIPLKLKAQGNKKPEFEACSARGPLSLEVIPSTSNIVSTKRQRKPKSSTAGTILNVQPGQHEVEGSSIFPFDNDNVLTKRQRKSKTCPAGMILNEPINSKSKKRALQPGQHGTDGKAVVLYDSKFSELQKKRQVPENSNRVPLDNGSQYNGSLALVPITAMKTTESLMKEKMPDLRAMAKNLEMKGFYKDPKAVLVAKLLKQLSGL